MTKFFITCFAVLFNMVGSLNAQEWKEAERLRESAMDKMKFDSALYYAEDEAALIRGGIGEHDRQYALALENLGVSHFFLGNYLRSKYYIQQEINLLEELKLTATSAYVHALENMTIICIRTARYEEGYEVIRKAEKLALKVYPESSPGYANILSTYGGV